jgi:hypothetical protein
VTGSRTRRPALALLVAAVLVRAAPLAWHGVSNARTQTPDSATYLDLARNLADGDGFGRRPEAARRAPENPSTVEIFRTPGYPAFLALLMRLGVPVDATAVACQILLDAVAIVLSFLAARRLLPVGWAVAAAGVQVVDVPRVVYADLLMSDTLFTFLVVLAIWLLADTSAAPGPLRGGAAGVIISLATAVRPLGTATVVPLALALGARRARASVVVLFVGLALVFPTAWIIRNGVRTGAWSLSSAFDYNVCLVAAAKVKAHADGMSRAAAEHTLVERAVASSPGHDLAARARAFRRIGLATLREHPLATLREVGVSALEMTLAGERRSVMRLIGVGSGARPGNALGETTRSPRRVLVALLRRPPLEQALVVGQLAWNMAIWLAFLLGVWLLVRQHRPAELMLYGLTVLAILVPSLVVGTARMRIPASPMIAAVAAAGGWSLTPRGRRTENLLAAAGDRGVPS